MAVDLPTTAQVDIRPAVEYASGKIVGDDFAAANDLEPTILSASGYTGTPANGDVISLTGANLGAKAVVAPWLFDNFEGGVLNADLTDDAWVDAAVAGNVGGTWKYSNADKYSGTQSCRCLIPDQIDTFGGVGRAGMNADEAYFSFYVKINKLSGTFLSNTIMKFFRVNTSPNYYNSYPSWRTTLTADSETEFTYSGGWSGNTAGSPRDIQYVAGAFAVGTWIRCELYIRFSSSAFVADGECKALLNGINVFDSINNITYESGNRFIDNFTLPVMHDRAGVSYEVFTDDFYADVTSSRVEISTSSAWAEAIANRTIQIPQTTWNSGALDFKARGLTELDGGIGPYFAYARNDSNLVNANGFAL